MKRKAHVRAAVVDGINLITVREETECVTVGVDHKPPRRTQLRERRSANEGPGCNGSHLILLRRVTPTG
jgi:isocitrate/isopropylmalate dehydrogenase